MLISVIVPIYKVEKYIKKCINSIISQSFKDFELILIDDGSPDNCGRICDTYANSDERIIVIHQPNQGVSCARNKGLEIARGKYICFIDADDYILPNYFETIKKIESCNYDMIKFDKSSNNTTYKGFKDFLTHGKYSGTLWSYIIKKELFDNYNIRFPINVSHSEDHCVLFKLISISNFIRTINCEFYKYQIRDDSAIHRALTHKAADSHLEAIKNIILFLKKNKFKDSFYYERTIKGIYLYFILLTKIPIRDFSIKHAKTSLNIFKQEIINYDNSIKNNFFIKHSYSILFCTIVAITYKFLNK